MRRRNFLMAMVGAAAATLGAKSIQTEAAPPASAEPLADGETITAVSQADLLPGRPAWQPTVGYWTEGVSITDDYYSSDNIHPDLLRSYEIMPANIMQWHPGAGEEMVAIDWKEEERKYLATRERIEEAHLHVLPPHPLSRPLEPASLSRVQREVMVASLFGYTIEQARSLSDEQLGMMVYFINEGPTP